EAVADGQQRIGGARFADGQAHLQRADDDAGDDVDEGDEQPGDGVAAHEFGRAVHGAEKRAFVLEILATRAGGVLVDEARREVGVDGHLLAGHGVEVEAGGHFGDAARTLGDDNEVDDQEDRENDDSDHEIAARDEVAEGFDHLAGGVRSVMAFREDEAGGGEIEGHAQHGRDQQHGGEGSEFERRLDEQRRHQDHHRKDERDGQQHVEHDRRHGQDQHGKDADNANGQPGIGLADDLEDVVDAAHGAGSGGRSGGVG